MRGSDVYGARYGNQSDAHARGQSHIRDLACILEKLRSGGLAATLLDGAAALGLTGYSSVVGL